MRLVRVPVKQQPPPQHPSRPYDSPVRRERSLETEHRILAAAERAFADTGYVGTSLAAIADAAGVNARTVYKVFGTKVRLLSRFVDVAIVRLLVCLVGVCVIMYAPR